jgi:DNA polymerase I-like protein with 3'-5' exonuclease and polymerase domains
MNTMDFTALEKRLLAYYTDKTDPHTDRASVMYEVPIESVTPTQRNAAKNLNYIELYSTKGRF